MSSFVWEHFSLLDNGEAKCSSCPARYNTKKTTAALRYHVSVKHPEQIQATSTGSGTNAVNSDASEEVQETTQNTLCEGEPSAKRLRSSKRSYSRKCPKSEAIRRSYVNMITTDMLPLSLGEGEGFQQFLRIIAPDYRLPSRSAVLNRIRDLYDSTKNRVLTELKSFPSVALTTDAWSSRNATSSVTVTLHAIDDMWNLKSFTLDTLEMSERHTGENLRDHLLKVVEEWKVTDKVSAVVHDNAANIISAMRLSVELGESMGCFSHTSQLAVNKALDDGAVSQFLNKISAIVGHFQHSNIASKALNNAQRRLKIPEHHLINRCKTRWNSTYAMAERVVEQRLAIEAVLSDREWTSSHIAKKRLLTDVEWTYLEDIVAILRPFDVATHVMSTESRSTIAMIRSLIHSLKNKFLKTNRVDSEAIEWIKETIDRQLKTRFLEDETVDAFALASILDPRFASTL